AAKAQAPSLAGAYSTNLRTVFITLINYWDWVGSHPNPNLVQKFMWPTSNVYRYWVWFNRALVKRGWRDYPDPTQVDFLEVMQPPSELGGLSGVVDVVINAHKDPYLAGRGRIVGYSGGGGLTAVTVSLGRESVHGRFRILTWHAFQPTGGIAYWERHLEPRS
ncbi:MAG TPA: hypothetical protein VED59_04160, partial [Acidimicrobiales bacterium]|nr:hypothetical protein [Acidimicrobiales bacterium]